MRITPTERPDLVGRVRVTLNGRDVTSDCMMADDTAGAVVLLCRDKDHHRDLTKADPAHLCPDAWEEGVCEHIVQGHVRIEVQA